MHKIKIPPIYFKLTIEETEKVLNSYIKPYYKDITYNVRKSDISNSIYVDFYKDGIRKGVRLSDHPIDTMKYNYISKRTRYKKVVSIFRNALKCFDKDNIMKCFDELKKEKNHYEKI